MAPFPEAFYTLLADPLITSKLVATGPAIVAFFMHRWRVRWLMPIASHVVCFVREFAAFSATACRFNRLS
jgi:hypothetical protein